MRCWESPDVAEGLAAFVEKRTVSFRLGEPEAAYATRFE